MIPIILPVAYVRFIFKGLWMQALGLTAEIEHPTMTWEQMVYLASYLVNLLFTDTKTE